MRVMQVLDESFLFKTIRLLYRMDVYNVMLYGWIVQIAAICYNQILMYTRTIWDILKVKKQTSFSFIEKKRNEN